ncbi:hypothetical protein E4K72_00210 [Oxalobacteraceae bacterium OM1]|nr:hypothetical protein E4K72_00210 [Oxalobacteraceae bacterium OM1]
MAHVLIVVTFLAGKAWGPVVSMTGFSNAARCEAARTEVLRAIDQLNGSNLMGGAREVVSTRCVPQ